MAASVKASCQLLLASKLLQKWLRLTSAVLISSKERLNDVPLSVLPGVLCRQVDAFESEQTFSVHSHAAQKVFSVEHERTGATHQCFGAALASAALLAFWGSRSPVADCDGYASSSDRTRKGTTQDEEGDHSEARRSTDDRSNAARPDHQKQRLPVLDVGPSQSGTGSSAARDPLSGGPLFSSMQVDRDGWFRSHQEDSPSQLSNSIASPLSKASDITTRSGRESVNQSEQPFAAFNINIASGGTPDLSLNTSPSSRSDPPWADEVSHARQGLAKRLANLEPGNTKAVPWPIISKKGQQVAVRFKLAPSADFSHFVVDAVSRLGEDPHAGAPSSGPLVRVQAYDR